MSLVETVSRKLGGNRTLGREVASEVDIAAAVSNRIPLAAITSLKRQGFSDREIERLVIPARTRRHRENRHEPLTVEESDRLMRLARIQAIAEDVFDAVETANRWLREPLGIIGGETPLEFARTEAGVRVVEQILAKIDWGAAA